MEESSDTIGKLKTRGTDLLKTDIPSPKQALDKLHKGLSSTKFGPDYPLTLEASFASLCVLSYERPNFLRDTLRSLTERPGHNYQLIIHDDGSTNSDTLNIINEAPTKYGATIIKNKPGWNEGQGTALNRMFTMAKGDPIIKLDADLHYYPGWLLEVKRLFSEYINVGMMGLLHYYHEPVDSRKTVIVRHDEYSEHTHILGSAFAMRRACWEELGPFSEHSEAFAEDNEMQIRVSESKKWKCILPKESLCKNLGMGASTSTVVNEDGSVTKVHNEPYIIRR